MSSQMKDTISFLDSMSKFVSSSLCRDKTSSDPPYPPYPIMLICNERFSKISNFDIPFVTFFLNEYIFKSWDAEQQTLFL